MNRLLVLIFLVLGSFTTFAQNINQFSYSLNNTYSHIEGALLEKQLLKPEYVNYRYLIIASFSYADDPLIVKDTTINQRENPLITNYSTFTFGAGYHFSKRFLLGAYSSFTKASLNGFNPATLTLNGFTEEESALDDTKIIAKWRLTGADKNFALALIPKLSLPTGSEASFKTDNSVGFGIDLAYETIVSNTIQLVANLGYYYASEAYYSPPGVSYTQLDYRHRLLTSIGAYIPFTDQLGANIEYLRHWAISSQESQNPNELYAGLRYQAMTPLALFAGAAFGNIDSSKDSNDFKFSAGLKFHGGSYEGKKPVKPLAEVSANDDFATVAYGKSAIIDALQNDLITDPGLGYLKIVSNSHPMETKCEIVKSPLAVKYSQIRHFVGTSVCRYEYCSHTGLCDQADIHITVNQERKPTPIPAEPFGNLAWNKSIYFCNDCDFLNARSIQVTKELKDYIKSRKGRVAKIVVEGHTSLVASKAYNLALSKRRARNTYKQLRKLGIPASMIQLVAYGESRPEIKSFESSKKHPTNRRVEFRIYEAE